MTRAESAHSVDAHRVDVALPSSVDAWAALADICRRLSGTVRVLVVRFEPAPTPAITTAATGAPASLPSSSDVESCLAALARPDLVSIAVADAVLRGPALAIALGCDLRLCCLEAGLRPAADAFGSLARLADLVGYSRALEMCLTGREVTAEEAVAVGLAALAVRPDEMAAALDDLTAALTATPRDTAIEMKAALASSGIDKQTRVLQVRAELAAAARLACEHD